MFAVLPPSADGSCRERGTASQAVVQRLPGRPGDVGGTFAEVGAAREGLGWAPAVPLDEGLQRTVEWLRGAEGREFCASFPQ